MLFDPNEKNNSDNSKLNNSDDDFVGSSFAVSFKPNDPANSVSDKLKNSEDKPNATDSIKDDFDSFEFDPSISAFKPIGAQAAASKAPAKEEPAKKDISPEAAVKKTEPIDFAISEADKKTSPFVNATKPDMPKPSDIDFPSVTSENTVTKKPESYSMESEDEGLATFGTVASGVDAFKHAAPDRASVSETPVAPAQQQRHLRQQMLHLQHLLRAQISKHMRYHLIHRQNLITVLHPAIQLRHLQGLLIMKRDLQFLLRSRQPDILSIIRHRHRLLRQEQRLILIHHLRMSEPLLLRQLLHPINHNYRTGLNPIQAALTTLREHLRLQPKERHLQHL
ncbi:MAG: hypothetical protein LKM40_07620 [Mageeibacillus sp.]|jgi:hypothetical protein|nr:hypothetical protein [Mageeibacillus sp.]